MTTKKFVKAKFQVPKNLHQPYKEPTQFKPMLATTIPEPKCDQGLVWPLYCTPKIDGVRCLTLEGGRPVSRSLKTIPNKHIQATLIAYGVEGLDGELWIEGAETFGDVSSAVMSVEGEPDFTYYVFDKFNAEGGYLARVKALDELPRPRPACIKILKPAMVTGHKGFMEYWDKCANDKFEGVIARSGSGLYKWGRSTFDEQGMLKFKKFEDGEAKIINYIEQMTNTNPKTTNELGYSERSSAKAGKKPAGKLGKFVVKDLKTGITFEVGTGFTDKQRRDFWKDRQVYRGKIIKYKHQPSGALDKPRFPVFLGFRHKDDM